MSALFIWPPSWINSISFSAHTSTLLVIDLLISIGAAKMTILLMTAPLVLVLLTNTTITLVLLTRRKSGKCDYWCCLFAFP
jgi:hypothetical protein